MECFSEKMRLFGYRSPANAPCSLPIFFENRTLLHFHEFENGAVYGYKGDVQGFVDGHSSV